MSVRNLIPLFMLCCFGNASGDTVVYDHFDDGVLDAAWEITFNEIACG